MPVYIKFLSYPQERESEEYGPFDSVQLAYESLRANFGDNTYDFAHINSRGWWKIGKAFYYPNVKWSDVLIYSK
jgi:hypothetical protein